MQKHLNRHDNTCHAALEKAYSLFFCKFRLDLALTGGEKVVKAALARHPDAPTVRRVGQEWLLCDSAVVRKMQPFGKVWVKCCGPFRQDLAQALESARP